MKPYDANAKCPKCGNAHVRTIYHDGGWRGCNLSCPARSGMDEHLLRHCERCHYEWTEVPLASSENPEGSDE